MRRRLPVDGGDQEGVLTESLRNTLDAVRPFTMTSSERVVALVEAVEYVQRAEIPGAFVECGVWRGGSMMAVARTLIGAGGTDRDLHLFDTFEGMSDPTDADFDIQGNTASQLLSTYSKSAGGQSSLTKNDLVWCYATEADVRANLASTEYPSERMHFVKGLVEETIPGEAPEEIALLRLDTDWYESTKHELIHLYPRLSPGGVLILDDYGHWQGARRAVDEYFEGKALLHRIDYSGRLVLKR